jgi:excisionase family DNA binding protein
MDKKIYTVPQVADMLHLRARTVREYIASGDIKALRIGITYRITEEALNAFIEKHNIKTLDIPGK